MVASSSLELRCVGDVATSRTLPDAGAAEGQPAGPGSPLVLRAAVEPLAAHHGIARGADGSRVGRMSNRRARRAVESASRRASRKGWGEWQKAKMEELESHRDRFPIAETCSNGWRCHRFTVLEYLIASAWGEVTHLHVRIADGGRAPTWAEMHRIKNELVGESRVGVEVFPSNVNLVDQADAYHIWALPEGFELPFGLHLPGAGYR